MFSSNICSLSISDVPNTCNLGPSIGSWVRRVDLVVRNSRVKKCKNVYDAVVVGRGTEERGSATTHPSATIIVIASLFLPNRSR